MRIDEHSGSFCRALCVLVTLALTGCATDAPEVVDPDEALEPIFMTMRGFVIQNEFHYADHRRYTDDMDELTVQYEFRRDSVNLEVYVTDDGQGLSIVGTHERLGPEVGCVLVFGNAPTRTTPGGRPNDGSNRSFVCDQVFDDHQTGLAIADPPG